MLWSLVIVCSTKIASRVTVSHACCIVPVSKYVWVAVGVTGVPYAEKINLQQVEIDLIIAVREAISNSLFTDRRLRFSRIELPCVNHEPRRTAAP